MKSDELNSKNLTQFLNELRSKGKLTEWKTTQVRSEQFEIYFVRDIKETQRQVEKETATVEVIVRHSDTSQGHAALTLAFGNSGWQREVEKLCEVAALSHSETYSFAGENLNKPNLSLCFDAKVAENPETFISKLSDDWRTGVASISKQFAGQSGGHFEAKVVCEKVTIQTSRGLKNEFDSTGYFVEGSLVTEESERYFSEAGSNLSEFSLEKTLQRYALELQALPQATTPRTGHYNVVISGQAVADLFSALMYDFGADAVYQGVSQLKLGETVGASQLEILANPPVPGICFMPVDNDGLALSTFDLVKSGKAHSYFVSNKYAQLTKQKETGGIQAIEVKGGTSKAKELIESSLPKGSVIEVVEFSSFSPDPVSKEFAGEIRFGRLHTPDGVLPIRGGSISGSLAAHLPTARLSTETQLCGATRETFGSTLGYFGPRSVLFEGLSYSGSNI